MRMRVNSIRKKIFKEKNHIIKEYLESALDFLIEKLEEYFANAVKNQERQTKMVKIGGKGIN